MHSSSVHSVWDGLHSSEAKKAHSLKPDQIIEKLNRYPIDLLRYDL